MSDECMHAWIRKSDLERCNADLDRLEAENAMLREMLSESRQACEHLHTELKRYKSIFRTRPKAMNALFDENTKLRELVCKWYPHMLKRVGRDALEQWGQMDVVRELRIEVDG